MTVPEAMSLLRTITENDAIVSESPISEIGDSLDMLDAITHLETATGKLLPEYLLGFETCGEIAQWIAG